MNIFYYYYIKTIDEQRLKKTKKNIIYTKRINKLWNIY